MDGYLASLAFSVVLAGTLAYAWRVYRQPYLGAWAAYWALYACAWTLLAATAGLLQPGTPPWLLVEALVVPLGLAARAAAAVGTGWYLGWSVSRRTLLYAGAGLALVATADLALRTLHARALVPWAATLPFRTFTVGAAAFTALSAVAWGRGPAVPDGARRLLALALAGSAASDLWDVGLAYLWRDAAGPLAARLSALGALVADALLSAGMLVAAVGTERARADDAAAELRRRDAQLQRAQRLESIGQLAGGLAHDFNNLLTAIVANLAALRERLPDDGEAREDLEAAQSATERATRLTRQLLTFARRQAVEPRLVDLNDALGSFSRLIGPLVGERIALHLELGERLWPARVDPAQLEQLVLNFVLNARDAMPAGGHLTISTANVAIGAGPRAPEEEGVPAGEWVRLAVDDTGHGIEAGLRQRIFEPFFTTKPTGRGSGLGLATVLGIAQSSGGHVGVRSAPGQGSRFALFLPRQSGLEEPAEEAAPGPPPRGSETILVVEDDALVRISTSRTLGSRGYRVLQAANGREALAVLSQSATQVDLVVTDVVMPEMGGRELARELLRRDPRLVVLLVSGYASGSREAAQEAVPLPFLPKPFTPDQIAERVRQLIDGRPAA